MNNKFEILNLSASVPISVRNHDKCWWVCACLSISVCMLISRKTKHLFWKKNKNNNKQNKPGHLVSVPVSYGTAFLLGVSVSARTHRVTRDWGTTCLARSFTTTQSQRTGLGSRQREPCSPVTLQSCLLVTVLFSGVKLGGHRLSAFRHNNSWGTAANDPCLVPSLFRTVTIAE